ncbi:MAG: peptide-methionine (S)-S-oxide reductase MsrA [Casimicrobiaceae bacterium]
MPFGPVVSRSARPDRAAPWRSIMIGLASRRVIYGLAIASSTLLQSCTVADAGNAATLPPPAIDAALSESKGLQTAVFAGGCFWGVEAVFRHVEGVSTAVSGYAGGRAADASYDTVGSGSTGHAESVQVTYDPARVSYGQLLRVLFSVAHDPTQLNRQGPDVGTQYRSAIFYATDEQKRVAQAYILQLDQAKVYSRPIVTQVAPLPAFYPAESYHQNYAALHPYEPYIAINDAPKVQRLREKFPELYKRN